MVPIADPHVCAPPPTADHPRARGPVLYDCTCGGRWHVERFYSAPDGRYLGSSWILDER